MSDAAIRAHRGTGIVVRGNDIDTDRIIPARYLAQVTFAGLEEGVFRDVRFTAEGSAKDHPFNEDRFQNATLLLANRNFGCGSSREHAPQALMRWGIRALIGESFAEIFFGNCVALGIPAVTASADDVAALMDAVELDPSQEISIDLEALTATSRTGSISIHMPDGARKQLLDGTWNAVQILLAARNEIASTAESLPYVRGF
jgi:3-isopropylmalate/(R)-2-methylmalate dehydratase small subunit